MVAIMNSDMILTPELTICQANYIYSIKDALKEISRLVGDADHRLNRSEIFDALLKRERLGSTAIGHGVAIPHARVKNVRKPICVFITLATPINFDAEDENEGVDLIIALLVPEEREQQHLDILAMLVEQLRKEPFRKMLREANSTQQLFQVAAEKFHIAHS